MATNTFIKSYNVQINNIISETGNTPTETLSLMLCSRRGNEWVASPLTLGPLSIPLYYPYKIPAQYLSSGSSILQWATSVGATIQTGISGSFVIPLNSAQYTTTITTNGSYVTFTFLPVPTTGSPPPGWSNLTGGVVTGTVTQATTLATGSIYLVSQTSYSLTLNNVTGSFDTTNAHNLTIAYVNNAISNPNGLATEQWVLDLFYAVEAINLQNTINLTFGVPNISISIVSDRDGNFNPVNTATDLVEPNTVTVNTDGTVTLAWNTSPTNWLYMPMNAVGNSLFTQTTSDAVGTIIQQLGPTYSESGIGVSIQLGNVTGTFLTTDPIVVTLDDTVTTFSLWGNNYYKFVNAGTVAELDTSTDFNEDGAPFVEYINSVNTDQATAVNQYGTLGVFAQSNVMPNNFMGNVQPNSKYFICPFYYYPNRMTDIYVQFSQTGAAWAAAASCNTIPFNPMYNVTLRGLPVSGDTTTYVNTGINSTAEALLQYGYTPIAVNQASGTAYMYQPCTTQTTINGNIDTEFWDVRTPQIQTEITGRLDFAVKQPQFQNTNINPQTITNLKNIIYTTLKQAESDNLIFNVDAWKSSIIVVQSNVNPHQINISCVIQITPALDSILITVNVVSSLITPPTTQA